METLNLKKRCIVYVAWEKDTCLYVGMSRVGIIRPMTNRKLREYRGDITKIEVYDCKNTKDALKMEREMTKALSPKLMRGRGRPSKEGTEVIWVRLPKELADRLRRDAKANGREVSGHIRFVLENSLKN